MTTPKQQVRRATLEDVPKLIALWKLENLPAEELQGRFKEFQVVEDADGALIGALGLALAGHEGCLHSEAFAQFDQADALRAQLLDRMRNVAANHGLVRLWTQFSAPFWRQGDFQPPAPEVLTKVPPAFAARDQPWLCLKLRDEPAQVSIDREFALFKEAEKENVERLLRQARTAKVVATVVVILVFILIAAWAYYYFAVVQRRGGR